MSRHSDAPRAATDPAYFDKSTRNTVKVSQPGDNYSRPSTEVAIDLSGELDFSSLVTIGGSAVIVAEAIVAQLRDGICPSVLTAAYVSPSMETALRNESRSKLKRLGLRIAILPTHPDTGAALGHPFKYITLKEISND